jgi:outer membrane protein OmpA-like peptidoglycan-associated protein
VVYFGVNNLFSNVFSDTYGMHGYVGVKVPIHYKGPIPPPPPPPPPPPQDSVSCNCCCPVICIVCCGLNSGLIILPDTLFGNDSTIIADSICKAPMISGTIIPLIISGPPLSFITKPGPPKSSPNLGDSEPITPPPAAPKYEPTTPTSVSPPEAPIASKIEFETAVSALSSSDKALLDLYAAKLKSDPAQRLRIAGHTDNVGTEQSNLDLSFKRAESTAKYLINKGVNPGQLSIESYGETQPVENNITPEGRQTNRRVEMELIE